MTPRRALASAAATTLLLALTACGDDDEARDTSPGSTSGASTGKQVSGEEFSGLLEDAIDKATTAHMTIDLQPLGSGEGDADYTKNPPDAEMRMSIADLGGEVDVRLVGGSIYLKSPSFGDKWVSAPLGAIGTPLSGFGQQLDLDKTFQAFADAVTSATDEGAEEVDGESLEHYTATIDTKKMLESLLPSADMGSVPDTTDQDWWFDDEGLVRKFSTDTGGGTTSITLSEWGEDVSIEAPPSDEVTALPDAGS